MVRNYIRKTEPQYSPELLESVLKKINARKLSINDAVSKYPISRATIYRNLKKIEDEEDGLKEGGKTRKIMVTRSVEYGSIGRKKTVKRTGRQNWSNWRDNDDDSDEFNSSSSDDDWEEEDYDEKKPDAEYRPRGNMKKKGSRIKREERRKSTRKVDKKKEKYPVVLLERVESRRKSRR